MYYIYIYIYIYIVILFPNWKTEIARSVSRQFRDVVFCFSNCCRLNMMPRQLPIKWIQSAKLSGSEGDCTRLIPRLRMSGAIPLPHLRLSLAERNNFTFRKIFELLLLIIRKCQARFIIIIRHEFRP